MGPLRVAPALPPQARRGLALALSQSARQLVPVFRVVGSLASVSGAFRTVWPTPFSGMPRGTPSVPSPSLGTDHDRVGPTFDNIFAKLQYTRPYLATDRPVSRPGCWAFPDMLEVGNFVGLRAFVEHTAHGSKGCPRLRLAGFLLRTSVRRGSDDAAGAAPILARGASSLRRCCSRRPSPTTPS